MAQGGFNFERAQQYLAQQNQEAVLARRDNATYNSPGSFFERRCMATALGNGMYNIDFMDGEGDMVVAIEELLLDNEPIKVVVEERTERNITQEQRNEVAESEIPSRIRVLICGDREWENAKPIKEFIENLPKSTIIIHGAAKGADTIAGRVATSLGMEVKVFPADWSIGKRAGPIRNTQMLVEGKPDAVVYFHNNLEGSKGTKNMVEQAEKAGVKVMNGNPRTVAEGD